MPKRIKATPDGWKISDPATDREVTPDSWAGQGTLRLACDSEPEERFLSAQTIVIEFPAFTDGRALSLAVLLRKQFGYKGHLRATGATHEDIVHYIIRCGFDQIDVPPGRDPDLYLALLEPYTAHYQGSVHDPEPSFKRTLRGINA